MPIMKTGIEQILLLAEIFLGHPGTLPLEDQRKHLLLSRLAHESNLA
jgi:hypothetical protein